MYSIDTLAAGNRALVFKCVFSKNTKRAAGEDISKSVYWPEQARSNLLSSVTSSTQPLGPYNEYAKTSRDSGGFAVSPLSGWALLPQDPGFVC